MSPLFLKFFKKQNHCLCCSSTKKKGYSVCPKHLKKAKIHWRKWQEERRHKGVCCYCDRKSYKGWLRCLKHTKYNRKVCLEWKARHPGLDHKKHLERQATYTDKGRCPSCKPHRKLYASHRRCWICRKRKTLNGRKIQTSVNISPKELRNLCRQYGLNVS